MAVLPKRWPFYFRGVGLGFGGGGFDPVGGLFAEGLGVDVSTDEAQVEEVEAGFEVEMHLEGVVLEEGFVFLLGA